MDVEDEEDEHACKAAGDVEHQARWIRHRKGLSMYGTSKTNFMPGVRRTRSFISTSDRMKWFGGQGLQPGEVINPGDVPTAATMEPSLLESTAMDACANSDTEECVAHSEDDTAIQQEVKRIECMLAAVQQREELVFFREARCAQAELQHQAAATLRAQCDKRERALEEREAALQSRLDNLDDEVTQAVQFERNKLAALISEAERLADMLSTELAERQTQMDAKIASLQLHEATFAARESQLRADYTTQMEVLQRREAAFVLSQALVQQTVVHSEPMQISAKVHDPLSAAISPVPDTKLLSYPAHVEQSVMHVTSRSAASMALSTQPSKAIASPPTQLGTPSSPITPQIYGSHYLPTTAFQPARTAQLHFSPPSRVNSERTVTDWHEYYSHRFGLGGRSPPQHIVSPSYSSPLRVEVTSGRALSPAQHNPLSMLGRSTAPNGSHASSVTFRV